MSYIEYIVMCVVYIQKIMRNFVVCWKKKKEYINIEFKTYNLFLEKYYFPCHRLNK